MIEALVDYYDGTTRHDDLQQRLSIDKWPITRPLEVETQIKKNRTRITSVALTIPGEAIVVAKTPPEGGVAQGSLNKDDTFRFTFEPDPEHAEPPPPAPVIKVEPTLTMRFATDDDDMKTAILAALGPERIISFAGMMLQVVSIDVDASEYDPDDDELVVGLRRV